MKIIKTYYLIDYENVGSEGFKGCEKLRETDIIHLFYTDNSRKIDLDIINDHGEAKLVTHKVPTGNQSADMHLGSYLGYLIGKECTGQDEECKIVVISKDTGFDHIIEFWKTEKDVKVSRNEKISGKHRRSFSFNAFATNTAVVLASRSRCSPSCTREATISAIFCFPTTF